MITTNKKYNTLFIACVSVEGTEEATIAVLHARNGNFELMALNQIVVHVPIHQWTFTGIAEQVCVWLAYHHVKRHKS